MFSLPERGAAFRVRANSPGSGVNFKPASEEPRVKSGVTGADLQRKPDGLAPPDVNSGGTRRNAQSTYTVTPSITFRTTPSIFVSRASSSASVQVTRMLKLMRRLMTASLCGKVMVRRSCGRPSSWATMR